MRPFEADPHNPAAKLFLHEYGQLEIVGQAFVTNLGRGAGYRGPKRSSMSAREKSQYVSSTD